ncbi:MAG: restriction endonuclease subunit S [Bacteroidetes bacterium]|nr:restriction endonuclease subunit S [Bacteroidota bacterium]
MSKEFLKYDLPVGWIWPKIEDLCLPTSGGTPSRRKLSYYNGDIPWVKSGELNYNTILETEEHITAEALEDSSAKLVPKNSLLIALYGATVGRLAYLGIEAATNQAVAAIRTFASFPNRYLYYFLYHNKERILRERVGGAQPNISQAILNNINLPSARLLHQYLILLSQKIKLCHLLI